MTIAYIIAALILIAFTILYLVGHESHITYLTNTDDRKWKRITQLHYSDNILSVTTFDNNIRQFYHAINDPVDYTWTRYPSKGIIKDNKLVNSLNKCYKEALGGKFYKGVGWVKVF